MYVITEGTDNLQSMLVQRGKHLQAVIREAKEALAHSPEGRLRATHNHGRTQYFWRTTKQDRLGTYISKKNRELISGLAQKEYDETLLKHASEEYRLLHSLLHQMESQRIEDIYPELNDLRRPHVSPRAITDEQFVQEWLSEEYEHKPFRDTEEIPEFVTDLGERVRSKSELMLANSFHRFSIPYHYEYPLKLRGIGQIYPDFKLLLVRSRRTVYLEHNGMMGDPSYLDSFMKRQAAYIKNGYIPGRDVIFTFESSDHPLDSKLINRLCEELAAM